MKGLICMKRTWPIEIDCPNCAAKLEAALAKLPGVEAVTVNYVQKRITLEAADAEFAAVTAAVLAKTAEIEPDTVIHVDGEGAQHAHAHHHEHGDCCGCHEHHEHHEHGHAHGHQHGSGGSKGRRLLLRVGAAAALLVLGFLLAGRVHPAVSIACFAAAYLSVGYDILYTALRNILRGEMFDENFLMAVASLGAMVMGEYAEGAAVMALYQVGEYFQDKAVDKSRASIAALMDIRPDQANLLRDGEVVAVHPEEVRPGEMILVRPGEKVPLDGVVAEGASTLNTAALTGESLPREVQPGDSILGGCVNLTGALTVRVTAAWGESTVARILRLVEESGDAKAQTERFITRFAKVYTPIVCLAAVLLAVLPSLFDGDWGRWIYQALTFLVISCPCALVISVPLTFFSGIGGASMKGVMVKGANHLEMLARLDAVALDKTGTLTKGEFAVTEAVAVGMSREKLLELAAHAECHSVHPISGALRSAWGQAVDNERVTEVTETAGQGVSALVDGRRVLCGNARLMAENGITAAEAAAVGTVVHVAVDGAYAGHIVISDVVKDGAAEAVAALKAAGVKALVMLTGDREAVAAAVAAKVGLTNHRAELLPEGKVRAVESLQAAGHTVAFVGDGVNDAPVLRRADLGIAMGGLGSDAAIEAADVVLMDDNVGKIALAMRIARRTMAIARQNIAFALGVKMLVMLLGVFGVASMWLAVFADVGVAMLCIINAMRALRA